MLVQISHKTIVKMGYKVHLTFEVLVGITHVYSQFYTCIRLHLSAKLEYVLYTWKVWSLLYLSDGAAYRCENDDLHLDFFINYEYEKRCRNCMKADSLLSNFTSNVFNECADTQPRTNTSPSITHRHVLCHYAHDSLFFSYPLLPHPVSLSVLCKLCPNQAPENGSKAGD